MQKLQLGVFLPLLYLNVRIAKKKMNMIIQNSVIYVDTRQIGIMKYQNVKNAERSLKYKVKIPANVFTYTFGIITALVAGVGMCLSMKVIGNGSTAMFVLGVIVGIIGLLGMGVNYPIYKKLLAQGKQKYAFEIMELAKEISEK